MLDFSVTFIITIFNIVVLFFILKKLLFGPVTKFMADRAKRIQDSIDNAEKDKSRAMLLLSQYETQLANAESEADKIIREAKEKAHQESNAIIKESKMIAEKTLSDARAQIEAERRAALMQFGREAAMLVTSVSGRLLGREINPEDSGRFAKMLLDEMSAKSAVEG